MNSLNETVSSIFQMHYPTYDPQSYAQNAPVLRVSKLAPPAKRNAFRDSERRRHAELERQARKN